VIGLDANLLLYAYAKASPEHVRARSFLESLAKNEAVAVSEFTLTEFYLLLRNPAVLAQPLSAEGAVEVIDAYRNHPCWRIPGFPPSSRSLHDNLWSFARQPGFARRRIYDVRTALTLQAVGVDEFATANVKDFKGLGFKRVWNPLVEGPWNYAIQVQT
jgi:predicted nucleic acid-binding protein